MTDAEEIKAKIDIVDFINDTHSLTDQNDGIWWKGHTEAGSDSKTSLAVNKPDQYYKNHATGNGGDIYNWIAFRENLDDNKDFPKILKIAADYAGIELKNTCNNEERDQVFDVLRTVVGYFNRCLTDEIRQHISNKWGITNETIDNLKIGYSPTNDPAGLQMEMKDIIHPDDLIKAGLIYDSGINLYRGRIIFPYWENEKVVYTIGRQTDSTPDKTNGGAIAKYVKQMVHKEDKPNVSKYITNNVIYGIDSVKDVDDVVITEGITDAIVLLQAGIPTISPITTSFKGATFSRVLQLLKDKKYIYICNDNDKQKGDEEKGAGEKGALKTIKALNEAGLEVRFIQLPRPDDVDKMDVAEYMKDHTVEDFRVLMDNAVVHKPVIANKSYRMNDTGNAQRMNDLYGDDLLYCHKSKKWLTWDGCRWREDDIGNIYKLAKNTVEAIHDYADDLEEGSHILKWQKHASSSGSTAKIKAMVENLQSEDNIPALMENMDLNKWILTTENGTINLKTEKLYESKREDMCTKMINVVYDPAASCPTWNKFLNEVLPNPDTQRYVKECLGSALTGDTSEENMFIMYGTGSNGKSVLMDTVSLLLGDFAVNIKASTLLTSDNTQHTHDNEIAMLRGARLVTASEPKKGMRLSDDVIKAITNSKAKITARRLYQEPFEFYPTHKTFFSSNHKPTVSDHSRGVWRRLRLIPFVTQVSHLKIKTHVR